MFLRMSCECTTKMKLNILTILLQLIMYAWNVKEFDDSTMIMQILQMAPNNHHVAR